MLIQYQSAFLSYMKEQLPENYPASLYEPASYIMQLGGKRIRPILALLAADAVGGSFKSALPAALAVEVFHNFSLAKKGVFVHAGEKDCFVHASFKGMSTLKGKVKWYNVLKGW